MQPYICKKCGKEMWSLKEVVEYWDDIYCRRCNPDAQINKQQEITNEKIKPQKKEEVDVKSIEEISPAIYKKEKEEFMSSPTKKQRIVIVISAIWILLSLVFSLSSGDGGDEVISIFLFFGVLPVGIGWGIWWIKRGKIKDDEVIR